MNVTKELYETLKDLRVAMHDDRGRELLNPVPLVLNTGLKRPMTLQEQIKRVLRTSLSEQAQMQGRESFEEADDFDVPDEFEMEVKGAYEMREEFLGEPKTDAAPPLDPEPKKPPENGESGPTNQPGEEGKTE